MTKRTCRWVARRLPLLVGTDLTGSERRRVERHLIGCPDCRSRRDAASASLAILQDFAAISPVGTGEPPSLWPALAQQIREAKHCPDPRSLTGWVRSWHRPAGAGWVASGLAAALLFGLVWSGATGRPGFRKPGPAAPVAPQVVVDPVAPVIAMSDPALLPLLADKERARRFFEEFDELVRRFKSRSSALATGAAPGVTTSTKAEVDPFAPPLNMRYDYELDYGMLLGPASDTQRAY